MLNVAGLRPLVPIRIATIQTANGRLGKRRATGVAGIDWLWTGIPGAAGELHGYKPTQAWLETNKTPSN